MIKNYRLDIKLENEGWEKDVVIAVDSDGKIVSIESFQNQTIHEHITGIVLPGFQNAHSHAFQYAMAGLAEIHSSHKADNFWSWREAMYQLALTLQPDQIEAIAAMLYAEMVRNGYTNVAEFHYLHHDVNGKPYQNLSETGERLVSAAKQAGIQITLVPIFYQKGGFGQAPSNEQKRFISNQTRDYLKLLEASKYSCKNYKGANLGMGIHSIRAVDEKSILETAKVGPQNIPFHIHVSEQLKEIEDSIAYLKQRPVEFLQNALDLNDRFHLVHATHLTEEETFNLAKSKANVVLCPTTEGNLGDGLFPFEKYKSNDGHWSIGTDSHIGINPFEELRLLDYGQRLTTHQRNTFVTPTELDSGLYALKTNLFAGRKAMNNYSSKCFEVGEYFNAVVVDNNSPLLACTEEKYLASTLLYSTDASMIKGTFVAGKYIDANGDDNYNRIKERFVKVIGGLGMR